MQITTKHISVLVGIVGLLIIINLLGRTKPNIKKGQQAPKEEIITSALSEEVLLAEARTNLDSTQLAYLSSSVK